MMKIMKIGFVKLNKMCRVFSLPSFLPSKFLFAFLIHTSMYVRVCMFAKSSMPEALTSETFGHMENPYFVYNRGVTRQWQYV